MIRDWLVVGFRDNSLSESLQTDPELTLKKAKTKIQQKEAVREQQQTLKGADSATSPIGSVDAIGNKCLRARGNPRHRSEGQIPRKPTNGEMCGRCGRERHSRDKCPAKDVQCHNCKRTGHYSAMCHQKTVSSMIVQDLSISGHAIQRQPVCVDLQGQR